MASFEVVGPPTPPSSGKKTTSDPNRAVYGEEDRLRRLIVDAEVSWKRANLSTLKGIGAFNKAVDSATKQLARYARVKQTTPTAGGLNLEAELSRRLKGLERKSTTVQRSLKDVASISIALEKSIDKLNKSSKGKDSFVSAFDTLREGIRKGTELLQSDTSRYSRTIVNSLKSVVGKALEEATRNASYIPKFRLGRTGPTRPGGLTSMPPFYSQIPANRSLMAGPQNFMMGGSSAYPSISRPPSRRFTLRGGPYDPDAISQYPGAGMGGHGGLPVPRGGGFGGGGPPIIASYRNLPVGAENHLPSGNYGQNIYGRRFGGFGNTVGRYIGGAGAGMMGGGGGWGRYLGAAAAGVAGAAGMAIGGGLIVGDAAWQLSRAGNDLVEPTLDPYNAMYHAANANGSTYPKGIQDFLTGGRGGLGVTKYLARLGYKSVTDASEVMSAYGSGFRPEEGFLAASDLGNQAGTGVISKKEWGSFLAKTTGMGVGVEGKGIEQTKAMLIDAFAKGAGKALPSKEVFENMNRVLDTMASTGTIMSMRDISSMAVSGGGSMNPAMRDASAQTSAMSAFSGLQKNILGGTGLNYTAMLSESKRVTGSTNPTGRQMQKLLDAELGPGKYKLTAAQMKYIDDNRSGPLPPGSAAIDMLAHAGVPPEFIANMIENTYKTQLKGTGMTGGATTALTAMSGIPEAARTNFYDTHGLGHKFPALVPFTAMSSHARLDKVGASKFTGIMPTYAGPTAAPLPAELAHGETGKTREVSASGTAAELDIANGALATFGTTLFRVNNIFDSMFNKINHFVNGGKTGHGPGVTG